MTRMYNVGNDAVALKIHATRYSPLHYNLDGWIATSMAKCGRNVHCLG